MHRTPWQALPSAALFAAFTLVGCSGRDAPEAPMKAQKTSTLELTSSAFRDGQPIPAIHTCDGDDLSPPLAWRGAPQGTVSWALVMDDPDAPKGTWDHWVLWNLQGTSLRAGDDGGGVAGANSWGRTGYGGPCPPSGTHRYVFRLLALDKLLDLEPGGRKDALLAATQGHVLAEARLVGSYTRG
jgi:hypothetical protein